MTSSTPSTSSTSLTPLTPLTPSTASTSLSATRANRWRMVVFGFWLVALCALLVTQKYSIFLRPEFGILLGLGAVVLVGFMIHGCFGSGTRPLGPLEIIRGCILIMPLAYLVNSGEKLDASAFKNRFLGPVAQVRTLEGESLPPAAGAYCRKPDAASRAATTPSQPATTSSQPTMAGNAALPGSVSDPKPANGSQTAEIKKATLLDLSVAPQQYLGNPIAVVGMLTQSDEYNKIFKGDFLLLFRFNITCCAADSTPVYALLQSDELPKLPENTWVEANGRFEMRDVDGYRIPIIHNAVLKETTAPVPPYLY